MKDFSHVKIDLLSILHELEKIERNGTFNVEKFAEFAQYHQALLFPAFQLQHMLQEKVLGVNFWRKCSERRIQITKGKYVALKDLMYLVREKTPIVCSFNSVK